MICKLCNQFYLDGDSIIGLFSFSEICDQCKDKFKPHKLYEVIPVNNGLIEYHYLYENMNLNVKQKEYLSKYLSVFYEGFTEDREKFELVIFLDDNVYFETSILGQLLNDFNHIFVFSLMRKELMYKMIF